MQEAGKKDFDHQVCLVGFGSSGLAHQVWLIRLGSSGSSFD
jgi:hypothetical protein